jgi:acyl-CoA synthetase (NDP forming)
MEALWRFVQSQQETAQIDQEPISRLERPAMRATLAAAKRDLSEFDAKKVLAAYGLTVTTEHLARDADAAVNLATSIGYPIALKIVSADIPHKTEARGVRLNLADAQGVRDAYDAIHHSVALYAPQVQLDGVLVQAMVTEGIELILGVQDDPLFGLAIMCGLGGIYAEVFKDVSFRLLPITRSEAASMVQDLRCFPILNGARGKPAADIEALVDAIVSLAALALDLQGRFTDIDINPLFVRPAGQGVVVGDALIKIRP